jgi:hypothetical protein
LRLHAFHRLVDGVFDLLLDGVRQLGAVLGEELDAVVLERVVRGGNDDAGRQAQRARQVGDRGRRHRAGQHDVDAGGGKAGFQGRFEHVAGNARVLADQYRRAAARAGRLRQHLAGRVAEAHHEVRGDRRYANQATNAVGTKIFASHILLFM